MLRFRRKYNTNFERDFKWYISMRHKFNFDGNDVYFSKKGEPIVQYDRKGVNAKEAFFRWDSNGKIRPTKHPNLLYTLLKVKGSCNLHIKTYAQSRAECTLNKIEFRALCIHFKAPQWFRSAVEMQKMKYWIT